MPLYLKTSTIANSWRKADVYLKTSTIANSWRKVIAAYIKTADGWRAIFTGTGSISSTVTIDQSTNGTTFLTTLTGTNNYWSDTPSSLSYKFEWSSNGGSVWSDISTGVATNPSSGLTNTYTYSIPTSEVDANVNNLYKFSVSATYDSATITSTSSNTSIQGPTNISDLAITATGSTSISLSWTASTGATSYLVYYSTTPPSYTLGQTVVGSTSSTITGLVPGTLYYFKVMPITGTSNTYKGYSGNYSNIVNTSTIGYPSNTVAPLISPISGTAGTTTYSVTNGTWTGTGLTYTYQWKSYDSPSYVNAPGISTSSTYTPPITFFGGYFSPIKCVVTATNSSSLSTSVDSSNTATVAAQQYTVTWNGNGGSTPTASTGAYGTSITAPTPTRDGYTFSYWRNPLSGGDPIVLSAGSSYTIVGNITFYAIWTANTYYISYRGNTNTSGSVPSDTPYTVGGSAATVAAQGTLAKTNYTFSGWNTAANGSGTAYTAGISTYSTAADLILYAQWTINQYTVTYDEQGGTAVTDVTINAGTSTILPTTTRAGYTFNGWYDTASGSYTYGGPTNGAAGASFTPPSTITMYARWVGITYTISYNGNGSTSGSTASGSYTTGGSAYTIAANGFARTNYTFTGWNTLSGGGGTAYTAGVSTYSTSADLTLYAQWSAIQYTVTWSPNGGSVSPTSSSGPSGTVVTAPTPTYTGNTFLYWRDGTTVFNYVNQINPGGTWTIVGNTTFYAWWTPIQYTVTYNANGGSVSPASATVNYGSSVTLPTPTRSGYTFNGWYTASSGGTLVGSAGASYTPSSTITIYAQWTLTPVIPTVTIAANSSVTSTTGQINWTSTNQYGFSVTGTFAASASPSSTTGVYNAGLSPSTTYTGVITVTSSTGHTATANYSLTTSAQPTYTVTYNGNGGTTPSAQVVNQGSSVTLPSSTRTGYTFIGWYDTPSGGYTYGGPTNGAAGASFTPPSSLTMYARWTNNSSAGSVTLTTTDTSGAGGRFNFSNTTATGVTGTLTYYWTLGTAANHTLYNALTANTTGSQTTTRTTAIVFDVYSSFTGQDGGTYTSATATVSVTFL